MLEASTQTRMLLIAVAERRLAFGSSPVNHEYLVPGLISRAVGFTVHKRCVVFLNPAGQEEFAFTPTLLSNRPMTSQFLYFVRFLIPNKNKHSTPLGIAIELERTSMLFFYRQQAQVSQKLLRVSAIVRPP